VLPLMLLGAGLSAPMVTLSTVSLSSVPRAQMTGASSLYTLSRRVSGNIAYAVLATLVDRRRQFHRARLVEGVTVLAPAYAQVTSGFNASLMRFGFHSAATAGSSLAMMNQMLNRQATMLAYNDTNVLTAAMALVVLPMLMMLPRRSTAHSRESENG